MNGALAASARSRNDAKYRGLGREWATPPAFFQRLDAEFAFTLDAAANERNAKCPRYFTEHDDGLAQSWGTERVWCNPPYAAELPAWILKARDAAAAGALVVMLVPASTDLAWWHEIVMPDAAEVRFIRGRIRFVHPDGQARGHTFFPSAVVIFRPDRRGPPVAAAMDR